jgi:multiple sugar transport system substrate-binding protein
LANPAIGLEQGRPVMPDDRRMTISRRFPAGIGRRALLAMPLVAAIPGCTRRRDALTIWAMSTEGENLPVLTQGFERETGIAVDVEPVPWTAGHEKLLTAFAGGSLPDVMMLSAPWVAEFAMIGAIAPVPPTARALLADQFAGVRAQVRLGGRDYVVPWTVGPQAQVYRRDLLAAVDHDAPPSDWAAWKRVGHAIKARDPDRYAVLMLLNWPEHLFTLASQMPDRPLRERDTRGNFSSPGFREALGLYKSIFDEGLAPVVLSTEIADPYTLFAQGWFAILPGAPYAVGDLRRRAAAIPEARWATAPMPGPRGLAPGAVGVNSLAVSTTARDPERAWALIAYLCRADVQERFHALVGDLPSRPSAWSRPGLADDPTVAAFRAQVDRAAPQPAIPEWQHLMDEAQLVAERMVRGGLGVTAAAAEMDRRADLILAKRRWLVERGRVA